MTCAAISANAKLKLKIDPSKPHGIVLEDEHVERTEFQNAPDCKICQDVSGQGRRVDPTNHSWCPGPRPRPSMSYPHKLRKETVHWWK
jgi:hypothetical protein